MPEISVIVPVYNAEIFLHDCIDSILSQSFSDFELILVDDGSTDSCGVICDQYSAIDDRVRVIHQTNQGQAAARNHALTQSFGTWICFVDSDDLIHPQMLELLYDAAVRGNSPISLCDWVECVYIPEDFFEPHTVQYNTVKMDEKTLVELLDNGEYPGWVVWGKLIRREIIGNHLFCPGRVYEDNEAGCHWIYAAKQISRIPHKLYFYRVNPEGTTKSAFSLKKLDYLWALEQIIYFYASVGYQEMKAKFCCFYSETAAGYYVKVLQEIKNKQKAREIKKQAWKMIWNPNVTFTKEQVENLFNAFYPKAMSVYWPINGGIRTLREEGLLSFTQKIMLYMKKGK